jgi:AcrR family transcriptional regulator
MMSTMAFPNKTSPEAIKAAAIDVLEQEGEAALTLRRIAGVLGITPNALYRYYGSRDVLIAAVADEVARRLLAAINLALAELGPASSAEARIGTLMRVYARFCDAHPDLYQTFATDRTTAEAGLPRPLGYEELWLKAVEVIEPLTGPANAVMAAVTLWSVLHGRWALKRANLLSDEKPDDIDAFAINAFLKGLAA